MKPWICEDSEFGGRELGGNTVILASLEAKFHIPNIMNFITDNLFIISNYNRYYFLGYLNWWLDI